MSISRKSIAIGRILRDTLLQHLGIIPWNEEKTDESMKTFTAYFIDMEYFYQ